MSLTVSVVAVAKAMVGDDPKWVFIPLLYVSQNTTDSELSVIHSYTLLSHKVWYFIFIDFCVITNDNDRCTHTHAHTTYTSLQIHLCALSLTLSVSIHIDMSVCLCVYRLCFRSIAFIKLYNVIFNLDSTQNTLYRIHIKRVYMMYGSTDFDFSFRYWWWFGWGGGGRCERFIFLHFASFIDWPITKITLNDKVVSPSSSPSLLFVRTLFRIISICMSCILATHTRFR